ncbi:MAG: hypothetical protein RLZ12_512, partial [Bacillota bacterium]|jgi:hypothetical protein
MITDEFDSALNLNQLKEKQGIFKQFIYQLETCIKENPNDAALYLEALHLGLETLLYKAGSRQKNASHCDA